MGLQPLKGTRGAAWFDVWKGRTKRNRKKKEMERWRREKINGHTRNGQAKATEGSARGQVFFWPMRSSGSETRGWPVAPLFILHTTPHLPPLVPVPLDLTRLRSLGHSQTSRATRPFSHNRLSSGHCNPGVQQWYLHSHTQRDRQQTTHPPLQGSVKSHFWLGLQLKCGVEVWVIWNYWKCISFVEPSVV